MKRSQVVFYADGVALGLLLGLFCVVHPIESSPWMGAGFAAVAVACGVGAWATIREKPWWVSFQSVLAHVLTICTFLGLLMVVVVLGFSDDGVLVSEAEEPYYLAAAVALLLNELVLMVSYFVGRSEAPSA